jgi:hypothetical protein
MKSPTCVSLLACCLATFTGVASAEDSLVHVSWNDCYSLPAAASNLDYACNGALDGTPSKLVVSFVAPANLTAFVGMQASIDVSAVPNYGYPQVPDPLPDWWRLGIGDCREGNLHFPSSLDGIGTGASGACQNPWLGTTTGGGYAVYNDNLGDSPDMPTPRPGWLRIKLAFARATATQLVSGQLYVAGVIGLDNWKDQDVGDGACLGCCTAMRIEPVVLEIYQISGTPPQDMYYLVGRYDYLGHPSGLTVYPADWQNGGGVCQGVPVKHTTWGAIKATYR